MALRGSRMKVGFVGLGSMGTGMAGRLLAAGHEVTVYNLLAHGGERLDWSAIGALAAWEAGESGALPPSARDAA